MSIEFLKLKKSEQQEVFNEIFRQKNLNPIAIEKDWWVVQVLKQIFEMEIANVLVFKGGTSLSKAWGLIERFSEDIDLALDRSYLGFGNELGKNQVDKLRRVSHQFIREVFFPQVKERFEKAGFEGVSLELPESNQSDKDPQTIELIYPSVFPSGSIYIKSRVLIEIGSRSLYEPFTHRAIQSLVGIHFNDRSFADVPVYIPTVNVERTFLEKVFLLHEEFQKPKEHIRTHRLSRHLYDVERIMNTDFAEVALSSPDLYVEIVKHRSKLTRINGLDYSKHAPRSLHIIPPEAVLKEWEDDYKVMQEQMIYGKSLAFLELIEKLTQLQSKINSLDWEIKL